MIKYALTIPGVTDRKATVEIAEGKGEVYSDQEMDESGKELAGILLRTLPAATVLAMKKAIETAIATHEEMQRKRHS